MTAHDGAPIGAALSSRRPLALLAALAVAGRRGFSREKLAGLLWPEVAGERARHSLTQAMYAMRRALRTDDLFLTAGNISLNDRRISTDVERLLGALERGDLAEGVSLYHGSFLDGFFLSDDHAFDEWAAGQRRRLDDIVIRALDTLGTAASDAEDHHNALLWRRKLATLRPLDSVAAAKLVAAAIACGDRPGAVEHALMHESTVRRELDVDPDPSFVALLHRLRSDDRSSQKTSAAANPEYGGRRGPVVELSPTRVTDASVAQAAVPRNVIRAWIAARISALAAQALRRRRLAAAGTVAAASLLVLVVALGRNAGRRNTLVSPANTPRPFADPVTLVAPFSVSGAARELGYLRLGIVQLLATRLAGRSASTPVSGDAELVAWNAAGIDNEPTAPRATIIAAARRLGADQVLIGSIVGTSGHMVVDAALVATSDGATLSNVRTEGSASSLSALGDDLTARILGAEAGGDSLGRRASRYSLSALRRFVRGKVAERRDNFGAARQAYRESFSRDTTFARAALDLAKLAARTGDADDEATALLHAWVHRGELTAHEVTELAAITGPNYPLPSTVNEQLSAWERLARLEPRNPESWYMLGSQLAWEGGRLGDSSASRNAAEALTRSVAFDSGDGRSARDLLIGLELDGDETSARSRTYRPAFDRSTVAPSPELEWRIATAQHDRAALGNLRRRFDSLSRTSLRAIAMTASYGAVGLDDALLAVRILAMRARTTDERFDALLAEHSIELNARHTVNALATTRALHQLRPESHAYLRLRVLDAIYGAGDADAAVAATGTLGEPADSVFAAFPLAGARRAADACVVGQWRLAHGDTASVAGIIAFLSHRNPLREAPPVSAAPRVCAMLLGAWLSTTLARPDAFARAARLDSLVLTSVVAGNASLYAQIALSRMFRALGHPRRALAAVRKHSYLSGWPAYICTTWSDEAMLARLLGNNLLESAVASRIEELSKVSDVAVESRRAEAASRPVASHLPWTIH